MSLVGSETPAPSSITLTTLLSHDSIGESLESAFWRQAKLALYLRLFFLSTSLLKTFLLAPQGSVFGERMTIAVSNVRFSLASLQISEESCVGASSDTHTHTHT